MLYVLSVSLTLLLVGLAARVYCYCKRPRKNKHISDTNVDAELSNLLKSAQDTAIQIGTIINSARHSRVVEGCAAGLTNGSQASAVDTGAGLNSCLNLGAAGNSCDTKGDTEMGLDSEHSSSEVQGAKKKKSIFKS